MDQEKNMIDPKSAANIKKGENKKGDFEDQLERVRRQLVLSAMGINIPKVRGSDNVDE